MGAIVYAKVYGLCKRPLSYLGSRTSEIRGACSYPAVAWLQLQQGAQAQERAQD